MGPEERAEEPEALEEAEAQHLWQLWTGSARA
jgi:hypothetical protein